MIESNATNLSNGLELLSKMPAESVDCVFFDPQYRGVLDAAKSGEISEERLNESLVRIIKVKQGIAGESN